MQGMITIMIAVMVLGRAMVCLGGGELIIFHAGSLSVPFSQIAKAFEREHPGIKIAREAAGSRTCARKISDLHRPCDVMASADYMVINQLMIPEYASWNIRFASNEMVIAYTPRSKYAERIDKFNWFRVLLLPEVAIGRSDPNSDPCGYRTVMVCRLAELYYKKPGLAAKLLFKDPENMRPKETDLLALLETGEIDYLFIYRSVAKQHGLKFILLPDAVNLKDPGHANFYRQVSVKISGKAPGTFIIRKGAPMIYGVTIPRNAPNPKGALEFLEFLLAPDKGMKIMEENGQPSVVPAPSLTYDAIPDTLKVYARPATDGQR